MMTEQDRPTESGAPTSGRFDRLARLRSRLRSRLHSLLRPGLPPRLHSMLRLILHPRLPPGWHSMLRSRPWLPFVFIALFSLITLSVAFGYYYRAINRALDFGEQTLVITHGDTLGQVALQLVERGVIDETRWLRLLARKDDLGRQIHPGIYRFPEGTTLTEFMQRIAHGKGLVGSRVTILEGWNFKRMRKKLRQSPNLKQTTAAMTGKQIMAKLGHPDLHPEGQFFPDTYYYTAGQTDLSIYRQAFQLMRKKLDLAWENRADNLQIASKEEALIMASIIEKESYIAEEQRRVAGVFHNRLKKGMRLQTDPTVIYGMGAAYKGNITRAHLKIDTPYNTYRRNGLTPTPISLPGEDALEAAVNPVETDAYYFVSKGSGLHQFSETLAQHNQAVNEHIRKRKRK